MKIQAIARSQMTRYIPEDPSK